eukprot:8798801-Karenia_brevis.AAC.1
MEALQTFRNQVAHDMVNSLQASGAQLVSTFSGMLESRVAPIQAAVDSQSNKLAELEWKVEKQSQQIADLEKQVAIDASAKPTDDPSYDAPPRKNILRLSSPSVLAKDKVLSTVQDWLEGVVASDQWEL